MAEQFVTYSVEANVATIVINNPPANALSTPLMTELDKVIDELLSKPEVKACVVTGGGTMFGAGADVKEIDGIKAAKDGEAIALKGQSVINKIENAKIPFIAAVNGMYCLGGSNELAMACHIRVAGDRVRFSQPEINLGIMPGFGGTQRFPRLVGIPRALEILLTGDMITAQDAKAIGLINKVVPDSEVLKQAQGIAKKIVAKGKITINNIMEAVRQGMRINIEEGLKLEASLFGKLCETQDKTEGVGAFLQKRQPKFADK